VALRINQTGKKYVDAYGASAGVRAWKGKMKKSSLCVVKRYISNVSAAKLSPPQ